MKYESLIFDFDGTLADSMEVCRQIFNELAEKNRLKTIQKDDLNKLKHYQLEQFLKEYKLSKSRFMFYVVRCKLMMKKRLSKIPLIEGFEQVLPQLKKQVPTIGILSSNSKENIEEFLVSRKLDQYFDFISNTNKLMNKAKYLKAIARTFSLDKTKMLYIGDEIRDLQAAKKSGIDFAGVPWGFNSKESLLDLNPTFMIKHPKDLLNISS